STARSTACCCSRSPRIAMPAWRPPRISSPRSTLRPPARSPSSSGAARARLRASTRGANPPRRFAAADLSVRSGGLVAGGLVASGGSGWLGGLVAGRRGGGGGGGRIRRLVARGRGRSSRRRRHRGRHHLLHALGVLLADLLRLLHVVFARLRGFLV